MSSNVPSLHLFSLSGSLCNACPATQGCPSSLPPPFLNGAFFCHECGDSLPCLSVRLPPRTHKYCVLCNADFILTLSTCDGNELSMFSRTVTCTVLVTNLKPSSSVDSVLQCIALLCGAVACCKRYCHLGRRELPSL
jgi:hypothetical protein